MAKARIIAAAALLVVGPAAALAGSGEYQNLNAMGLASEKGIRTKCDLYGQHEGKTYCFRDENAKSEFMKVQPAIARRPMLTTAAKPTIQTRPRATTPGLRLTPTAATNHL